MKINQHDAGHMIKMAAMPIYGINTVLKKILLPGTSGSISMKPCIRDSSSLYFVK